MNRTFFLAVMAAAVLLMQLLPTQASVIKWIAIALGLVYLIGRALGTYPQQFRDRRRVAAQREADDVEYRQYQAERESIQTKHDPNHDLLGNSELADAFKAELTSLHEKHREMLERKFGAGVRSSEPGQPSPTPDAG